MKAEINEHGALVVTAETGIEAFALRRLAGELIALDQRFNTYEEVMDELNRPDAGIKLIEPVGVQGGCYRATRIIINHQLESGHGPSPAV